MTGVVAAAGGEAHWDAAYRDHDPGELSWFQSTPAVSLDLVHRLGIPTVSAVVDVGGGTSRLVDALVADGFADLTVLDISAEALGALRQRLGARSPVTLVHGDVQAWSPGRAFDLWHDRAVLHFLVADSARRLYLDRLHQALCPGGHIVVGTFAPDGPQSCSGLRVARYSPESLAALLGDDFAVVAHEREEHVTPKGALQPFTWLAAQRRV